MTQMTAVRTVAGTTVPEPGTYEIDPSHSVVEFVVRHMGLAKVRGRFNAFEGGIEVPEDITDSVASATIQAASIGTRDETRDGHLRTATSSTSTSTPPSTSASPQSAERTTTGSSTGSSPSRASAAR